MSRYEDKHSDPRETRGVAYSPWLKSVLAGTTSVPAVRFVVGDRVEVLRAARLPQVEEAIGTGVVARITMSGYEELYWVDGFPTARTARELRLFLGGVK